MDARTTTICAECHSELSRSGFSGSQWKKGPGVSRCTVCIEEHVKAREESEIKKPSMARDGNGAVRYESGTRVRISGLQQRTTLNGMEGLVMEYMASTERYHVKIKGLQDGMSLKAANLTKVEEDAESAVFADGMPSSVPPIGTNAKPKPNNVRRPRNLPPLFPGRPPWLGNVDASLATLSARSGMPHGIVKMMAGSCLQQRELDERFRHLGHVYSELESHGLCGEKHPRTLREHEPLFRSAGYDLSPAVHRTDQRKYILVEAFEAMRRCPGDGLIRDGSYQPPVPPPPRTCDHCNRICKAECICGEAYCDKDCQAADWDSHQEICETICENSSLAVMLTKDSWKGQELL